MELFTSENLIAFATLTALEIVLGIDNIIFISILSGKLEKSQQQKARQIGLFFAMVTRVLLLLALSWMMYLTEPLFSLFSWEISGRDLILLVGGLFLIAKATYEIHEKIDPHPHAAETERKHASFASIIAQIALLDIVFSLDSVITAIGMAQDIRIMIGAVIVAVIVMLLFARPVSDFVEKHPTFKMLALSFLLMIGVMLLVEGTGGHVEKGYIYFAMGFSLLVEALNTRMRAATAKT